MEGINMTEQEDNKEEKKIIKSVIIESELREWEEWGNRWFGQGINEEDGLYHKDDLKNKRR